MTKLNNLPSFIGIGAMRCGTTWLTEQLRDHPEIHIPPHFKEVHFFDHFFEKGIDWYTAHFADREQLQITGEFTPNYIRDEHALQRIHETCPEVKLILSLRNPIDRAFSHYNFLRIRKSIDRSFLAALQDPRFELLKAGLYGEQLQKCLSFFPAEQLHVINFDDIKNQPRQVMSGLYAYLGVDTQFVPEQLTKKANEKHGVKSVFLSRSLKSTRRMIRPYLTGRKGLMKLGFFKLGRVINRLNSAQVGKLEIEEEALDYLKDYYREDQLLLRSQLRDKQIEWEI